MQLQQLIYKKSLNTKFREFTAILEKSVDLVENVATTQSVFLFQSNLCFVVTCAFHLIAKTLE